MSLLGMYNVESGTVEGAEDPGRLFQKKHHGMSILSGLGLLQLKGCDMEDNETTSVPSLDLVGFHSSAWILVSFGLAMCASWTSWRPKLA